MSPAPPVLDEDPQTGVPRLTFLGCARFPPAELRTARVLIDTWMRRHDVDAHRVEDLRHFTVTCASDGSSGPGDEQVWHVLGAGGELLMLMVFER